MRTSLCSAIDGWRIDHPSIFGIVSGNEARIGGCFLCGSLAGFLDGSSDAYFNPQGGIRSDQCSLWPYPQSCAAKVRAPARRESVNKRRLTPVNRVLARLQGAAELPCDLIRRQVACEGDSGAIYWMRYGLARYPKHWYPGWYPQKCVFIGPEPRVEKSQRRRVSCPVRARCRRQASALYLRA